MQHWPVDAETASAGGEPVDVAFLAAAAFLQEIDIPEGSMSVPDEAEETVVVLDRRSTLDRLLAGAASLGALSGVLVLGSAVKHVAGI